MFYCEAIKHSRCAAIRFGCRGSGEKRTITIKASGSLAGGFFFCKKFSRAAKEKRKTRALPCFFEERQGGQRWEQLKQ